MPYAHNVVGELALVLVCLVVLPCLALAVVCHKGRGALVAALLAVCADVGGHGQPIRGRGEALDPLSPRWLCACEHNALVEPHVPT